MRGNALQSYERRTILYVSMFLVLLASLVAGTIVTRPHCKTVETTVEPLAYSGGFYEFAPGAVLGSGIGPFEPGAKQ